MSLFTKYIPYEKSVHETRNVTSHEHRAPTDESVRLLREMEEKSRDSVFATLRCQSTHFKVAAMAVEDQMNFEVVIRANFMLGDKHHDVEARVPMSDFHVGNDARTNFAKKVRDMLAEQIANQIVITALSDSVIFRR